MGALRAWKTEKRRGKRAGGIEWPSCLLVSYGPLANSCSASISLPRAYIRLRRARKPCKTTIDHYSQHSSGCTDRKHSS